jgi:ubiquitin C-terminal hydrolase
MNKIECLKCDYKSLAFDNFMDLSISIPRKGSKITGYIDLAECLKSFVTAEQLYEDGYKCKCKAG